MCIRDRLQPELEETSENLKFLLIPKDPEDTKDVVFEIRSGTGGDEASIFAGDLFRMYTKYFEKKGWKDVYKRQGNISLHCLLAMGAGF